jgi:stage V sporulation protein S
MDQQGIQPVVPRVEDVVALSIVELRVSNGTPAKGLATSILRYMEDGKRVALSCIGPQTLNQAIKAVAIANGEAAPGGSMLIIIPSFDTKHFPDRSSGLDVEVTAMKLMVGKLPLMV